MYQRIAEEVRNLDIAIVVNNAGINYRNLIKDTSIDNILEMVIVNTYPYTLLTHKLINNLKNRNKKSALITICSSITVGPSAYDAIYGCTKTFELINMEALRLENLSE